MSRSPWLLASSFGGILRRPICPAFDWISSAGVSQEDPQGSVPSRPWGPCDQSGCNNGDGVRFQTEPSALAVRWPSEQTGKETAADLWPGEGAKDEARRILTYRCGLLCFPSP
jgi:hypothetical protein